MSSKLWQYFFQDDVEGFRRFLETARSAQGQKSGGVNATPKLGSPAVGTVLGSSPNTLSKSAKTTGPSPRAALPEKGHAAPGNGSALTRASINVRDRYGRTLLHHIASSQKVSAIDFAAYLLEISNVDIYAQDLENGWTSLHRALYSGNVAIAQALMERDVRDVIDFSNHAASNHRSGDLIKIKDWEGNSPFDLYGTTITYRDIKQDSFTRSNEDMDDDSSQSSSDDDQAPGDGDSTSVVKSRVNLGGDEVLTFGSNKNLSLGLGDQDDRQFPERVTLTRPEHLLSRFYSERETLFSAEEDSDLHTFADEDDSADELPAVIRTRPIIFQDIFMSKLHTAILTNDPESNLFMCGFGPGGRLGTGDEATRFKFVCIESGALSGKKIATVALGQDHSIAISEEGEVFSWGSNKFGQLGYNIPRADQKKDNPIQTTPRQIFNPFKRETILGAAASSIHSVVFSTAGLYTFGKNEGQLGLVDADARSLGTQIVPRRVAVSLFSAPIATVSAIDRATTCLLENSDVWVFTHYGYSKIIFPLDDTSSFIKNSFMITRYQSAVNRITKITSGGSTICAMSSFGEVYTVNVNNKVDTSSTAASTTNPAKIRNALPKPSRVWSIKKSHMAVRDVDVGQDGSIIICTDSGSAWRKEKRAKIKDTASNASSGSRSKDYKFVRVPGLSRVVAVRSNAFGAYAVAQRDCDVTKKQIQIDSQMLWDDIFPLLPFKDLKYTPEADEEPSAEDRPTALSRKIATIKAAVLQLSKVESTVRELLESSNAVDGSSCTIWISSTVSDVRIPVHEFVLTGRSSVLRQALAECRRSYYYSIPDVLAVEYGKDGQIQIQFQGSDFLSILNLVFYIYTDSVLDVWHQARHSTVNAFRYRQIRTEVMKIAVALELKNLERAARIMIEPTKHLHLDMEYAIRDPIFFDSGDLLLELDGSSVKVHSELMAQRCPFFEGLFHGRSGGRWLSGRRELATDISDTIDIDLKHIDPDIFHFVLRHIYADTGDELFENVKAANLDDFIDIVLDVMSVANELMIDRLAQICQKILGRFVNTRNVCNLLNAVAPCSVTEFKDAAFEYICLNLETMLENRLLDDLDEDLLHELVGVCRANQFDYQPISRGRNQEEYILERHPEIVSLLEQDRQKRIDAISVKSRREIHAEPSRVGSFETPASPLARKSTAVPSASSKPDADSPILRAKQSAGDLIFHMDDESVLPEPPVKPNTARSNQGANQAHASISPRVKPTAQASYLGRQSSLDTNDAHDEHAALAQDQTFPTLQVLPPKGENPFSDKSTTSSPWGAITVPDSKAGLKDIMAESSGTKPSSGTSAGHEGSHWRNFSPKLSQKERKRLQQQQQQLEMTMSHKNAKSSPWQTVGKAESKSTMKSILSAESSQLQNISSTPDRASSKPSMTLRQTVAGAPPQDQPSNPPKSESRSVSSPMSMPSSRQPSNQHQTPPNSTSSHHTESSATPRSIQTIRHASQHPSPIVPTSSNNINKSYTTTTTTNSYHSSSSNQLSLASILYQQQTEKDEIREAATAKHNLQEIQLEQEFQEWWDQESKRVMGQAEADAAAAVAVAAAADASTSSTTATSGRHGSAARGGRGKGKGRGNNHQHQHQHQHNHHNHRSRGGNTVGETSHSNSHSHPKGIHDHAPTSSGGAGRRKAEDGVASGHRDGGGNRRGHAHHRGRGGGGGHRGGRAGGGGRGKGKENAREQPVS